MRVHDTSISCGVYAAHGLGTVDDAYTHNCRSKTKLARRFINNVQRDLRHGNLAFVQFSDTVPARGKSPGMKIAAALESEWPGSVFASPVRCNPNSGNNIQVWLFAVPEGLLHYEPSLWDEEEDGGWY